MAPSWRALRGFLDRTGESIAAPRNGHHPTAGARIALVERLAKSRDVHLNSVLFDDDPLPNARQELVLGDNLAACGDEHA
jgi:hypothetical protein